MIQLLPFVAIGYLGSAAIGKLSKGWSGTKRKVSGQNDGKKAVAKKKNLIHIVGESIIEDNQLVLASEDVPLDNRFGEKTLISEHVFSRSAEVGVEVERTQDLGGGMGANIFSLLEAKVQAKLSRTLGVKTDEKISREVRLKLSAAPGQFAHYRVVWKQDNRRGVYEVEVGKKRYTVPFLITYGLTHSVESINESGNSKALTEAT
jgi:hypothetical protein